MNLLRWEIFISCHHHSMSMIIIINHHHKVSDKHRSHRTAVLAYSHESHCLLHEARRLCLENVTGHVKAKQITFVRFFHIQNSAAGRGRLLWSDADLPWSFCFSSGCLLSLSLSLSLWERKYFYNWWLVQSNTTHFYRRERERVFLVGDCCSQTLQTTFSDNERQNTK